MDDLKRMAVFAAVVRLGSMTRAAAALGMSTSAVSQQVRALEQQGGVTLLHRTTRKLALTEAGVRFAEHCAAMVAASEQARLHLSAARDAPSGELRLSAPVGFARHVGPALAPLLADHPSLALSLLVDDALIDLVDARIDLALRAGRLPDSRWVAQRLCGLPWVICAAPEYLRRHGEPPDVQSLAGHQWIATDARGASFRLEPTAGDGTPFELRVQPRITSNNLLTIRQMCEAGLGLAMMVAADIEDELRAGRLVTVLGQWQLAAMPVWAVTPQRGTQPAKVRHAIAALRRHLLNAPGVVA